MLFPRRDPAELIARQQAGLQAEVQAAAREIVGRVRNGGEKVVLEYALRFNEREPGESLYLTTAEMQKALNTLEETARTRLERIAGRIRSFAEAQRDALEPVAVDVRGGAAGHSIEPVERAGCYAPGGRYPLPSSVLMTAITARVAGVESVWVASPKPAPITIAAAALSGADGLLAAGGAQAIAALAYGVGPVPPSDIVVGPGNEYVTAAKQIVSADVAIDMLAGPSELVVVGDGSSDPALVAADLLAQAEHDVRALPILVATDEGLIAAVGRELERQLTDLPTAETAIRALSNGGSILCTDFEEIAPLCDELAPEHLQLSTADPDSLLPRLKHYGAVFIGERSAEVFGDYGVGPNHVLPTGRTARATGGLSVFDFLRIRTWIRNDQTSSPTELVEDSAWLARQEGLEAHARAAEARRSTRT
jgi:phosphoribosyl-ATP pyrophosphohydrolase/phosphoribosyl-AMP cyclohydrolase/histidinol dehydrogenase